MTGFVGQYEHQMDQKGRVSLPSAFRRGAEGDRFVLLQWEPTYLTLFPEKKWAQVQESLLDYRRRDPQAWNHIRKIIANAVEVVTDKQGRILVPAALQASAGLEGAVLVQGNLDRVELWDPTVYRETMGPDSEEATAISRRVFV